jgi:hypothetical protein
MSQVVDVPLQGMNLLNAGLLTSLYIAEAERGSINLFF